ncbi:MAG: InlB B-repeat-containing protein [Bacilli bacterium]|nr:InlB B-repeat-containing protein [Bacilli bacterium]
MKKLGFLIMPLMAVSFLTNCNSVEHFVTFDSNGGTHVDTQRVKAGELVTQPDNPTRDDYAFLGWYTDNQTFTKPYNFKTAVTSDITLYANWDTAKTTYTILFKEDGVEDRKITDIVPGTTIHKENIPPITPKEGKTIVGWCTDEAGTMVFDFDNIPICQNHTLYAGWKDIDKWTITFDPNGGTLDPGAAESITVNDGAYFTESISAEQQIAIKENFLFAGWGLTSDSHDIITKDYDYQIWADTTVYAVYTPTVTANVTFAPESVGCRLLYGGIPCPAGEPVKVPANVPVTLKIDVTDYSKFLPIFSEAEGLTIVGTTEKTFDPIKQEITVRLNTDADCKITATTSAPRASLDDYTWEEISKISQMGLANKYFKIYNPNDSALSTKKVQLKHQDSNANGQIDSDEIYQTVRIIDFNKDVDKNNNPIGITFEFANTISDADGHSLTTQWNDTSDSMTANYNYLASTIRKALNGTGDADHFLWAERGQNSWSSTYTQSVLEMLPDGSNGADNLLDALKEPKKYVAYRNSATADWEDKVIQDGFGNYDKLFLLSPREMGLDDRYQEAKKHTSSYTFYRNATEYKNVIRVKKQAENKSSYTATGGISWEPQSGQAYTGSVSNYAGYNYSTKSDNGGHYWLRSPYAINVDNLGWYVNITGAVDHNTVCSNAFPVAPCFCI